MLVYRRFRDRDLRVRAASGDLDAAGRLFDRHGAAVLAVARALVGRTHGEDAVETVVVQAFVTCCQEEPPRRSEPRILLLTHAVRACREVRASSTYPPRHPHA